MLTSNLPPAPAAAHDIEGLLALAKLLSDPKAAQQLISDYNESAVAHHDATRAAEGAERKLRETSEYHERHVADLKRSSDEQLARDRSAFDAEVASVRKELTAERQAAAAERSILDADRKALAGREADLARKLKFLSD